MMPPNIGRKASSSSGGAASAMMSRRRLGSWVIAFLPIIRPHSRRPGAKGVFLSAASRGAVGCKPALRRLLRVGRGLVGPDRAGIVAPGAVADRHLGEHQYGAVGQGVSRVA